jgi:hypothetical protein
VLTYASYRRTCRISGGYLITRRPTPTYFNPPASGGIPESLNTVEIEVPSNTDLVPALASVVLLIVP